MSLSVSMPPAKPYTTPKVDFTSKVDLSILKGKCALITGGASGMGAAMAIELAKAGCFVTVVDVNEAGGKAFVEDAKNQGLNINFAYADVISFPSLLVAFKSAVSYSPQKTLDIVIPFAGLLGDHITTYLPDPSSPLDPPPPPTSTIDVNLKGAYQTTYLALHFFRQSPELEKQIIFISSLLAYITPPMLLDYAATKEGIKGLFHSLRYSSLTTSLGLPDLRTNLIAPSLIRTPMTIDNLQFLEKEKGFAVGEISEVVNIALRVLCDKRIEGRAIAAGKNLAVDIGDDVEGQNGSRECKKLVESGLLGWGPQKLGTFRLIG